jgi:hypothetical protein
MQIARPAVLILFFVAFASFKAHADPDHSNFSRLAAVSSKSDAGEKISQDSDNAHFPFNLKRKPRALAGEIPHVAEISFRQFHSFATHHTLRTINTHSSFLFGDGQKRGPPRT